MKWQEIVDYALLDIGVKIPGESLDVKENTTAIGYLKLLINAWPTDTLLVPSYRSHTHTVVDSQNCYTLGDEDSDVDLEGVRIISVRNIRYLTKGHNEWYNLSRTGYSHIQDIQQTDVSPPSMFYWQNDYPESLLWFDTSATPEDKFTISFKSTLTSDEIDAEQETGLAPEYENTLRYCLAEELLGPFGVTDGSLMKLVLMKADRAKNKLRTLNMDDLTMNDDNSNLMYRSNFM